MSTTTSTSKPTTPSTSTTFGSGDAALNSVTTRELRKSFDGVEVLHGLDIDVEPGTIVGLIGPSGCGKTTTVRLMTGLLEPSSGDASIGGTRSVDLTSAQRARIGYLPQSPALFPDLSLMENLSFHASMYGLPLRRKRRLRSVLEWVELTDDAGKRVSEASGGMQRRLSLAAAFVHDPDIVFLDEPTAGIDPILRDKFWTQFREVAATGKTLVVTTQYVGEAGMCDVVGLLSDGELLLVDTPANLRRAAFDGQVIDVATSRPLAAAELARLGDREYVVDDIERTDVSTVRIVVDDVARAIDDINRSLSALGVEVVEASEHEVDYDEAFVRVVQRHRSSNRGELDETRDGTEPDRGSESTEAGA
jgi:ABC-2 type transport system ATP-binding protein